MRTRTAIWIHWALFALAITAAAWIVVLGYLQLDAAFVRGDLTRGTLFETLTYLVAVLALLWAAGWIVASRPKAPPRVKFEGYSFT